MGCNGQNARSGDDYPEVTDETLWRVVNIDCYDFGISEGSNECIALENKAHGYLSTNPDNLDEVNCSSEEIRMGLEVFYPHVEEHWVWPEPEEPAYE